MINQTNIKNLMWVNFITLHRINYC